MARYRHASLLPLCLLLVTLLSATASHAAERTAKLDINKASAQQIQAQLPGIGKVKAQAIVDYRNLNGPFAKPVQLLKIKGVGPHTLDRIRPFITFGGARALGGAGFFSQVRQQNQSLRDQAIRQDIKRIVTRAKQAATE